MKLHMRHWESTEGLLFPDVVITLEYEVLLLFYGDRKLWKLWRYKYCQPNIAGYKNSSAIVESESHSSLIHLHIQGSIRLKNVGFSLVDHRTGMDEPKGLLFLLEMEKHRDRKLTFHWQMSPAVLSICPCVQDQLSSQLQGGLCRRPSQYFIQKLYQSFLENSLFFFSFFMFLIGYFLYLHFKCYPLTQLAPSQKPLFYPPSPCFYEDVLPTTPLIPPSHWCP